MTCSTNRVIHALLLGLTGESVATTLRPGFGESKQSQGDGGDAENGNGEVGPLTKQRSASTIMREKK